MRKDIKYLIFLDLLKGLFITLKTFFKKPVTVQYPKEKVTLYPSFRGRHALVRDPLTGDAKCVACLKCQQVCPSRCIEIKFEINPETGERKMTSYQIEALRCIYCGYCEEVCPVGAIVLTEWFEYSTRDKRTLLFEKEKLLQNWDDFIAKYPEKVYTNKFWNLKGIPLVMKPAPKREGIYVKVRS
ncbi:MAG: NADH-quinone oxidoreductase subunit NuoI [Caldimicrobium sp.]